jgi:uncharacterized Zn finger protein
MTQTQRAALDAALARAERDGIAVMGQGTRKSDGARVFAVTSASQPGRWYLVVIEADGQAGRLHCDCPARSYCKHRAAVHARLLAEREASQREAERLHAERLAASEREHAREAAILYRNTRPFSIWRAE